MEIVPGADLRLLAERPGGVTVSAAAEAVFCTDSPSRSEVEKARRRLEKLKKEGVLQSAAIGGVVVYTLA
jgi:hypothetical protein